jgi:hypothetical protein
MRHVLGLLLASAALAGCSLTAPGTGTGTTTPSKLSQAQSTHEYPPAAPPRQSVSGAGASALAAVRSFATQYINWQADTVADRMRSLAAESIGQARSAMQLAAAHTAQDYELQRGGVANSGTVEAVAALPGHRNEYVAVTREQTTATATTAYQGLRPAWHLTLAAVEQLAPGKWVVSGWQPQT